MSDQSVLDDIKDYYGKVLKTSDDLKTNACKTACQKMPNHLLKTMKLVHDDVIAKYYGCGLVIPENVQGCKVLDLGSGSGRDCYILSKLVGESGQVTGIDMTEEQIDVARKFIDYHTKAFGFSKPNVEFKKGYIERLREAGIATNEYDVIVSNCVVNLSPDKRAVLREAYDSLKVGGEMYFSDVYCDKVIPEHIRKDKVLWGECLSGALAWTELVQLAEDVGFCKPRLVKASPITLDNEEMEKLLTGYNFVSATYRLVKLPLGHQPKGQVIYEGNIEGAEEEFFFDYATSFKADDVVSVDSEVATILHCSRYNGDFTFQPCGKGQNGSACCPKTKEHNPDPFALLEGKGSANAGCCAPSKKDSGCCPPASSKGSIEGKGSADAGCCAPSKKDSGCCPPASSKGSVEGKGSADAGCCAPSKNDSGCCPPASSKGSGCCSSSKEATGCCPPSKTGSGC